MKIGLVTPGFSSDASDWCIPVLVDVARELARRADVHVFALRYPDRRDLYRVHGAQVHSIGGGTIRGMRRITLLRAAAASVLAEHRRSPFTALHGLWADEPGCVATLTARILRIPGFVSVMGGELVSMPDVEYGGRLSLYNRLFTAIALRGATRVTAASSQPLELLHRTGRFSDRRRIARLVWGVDPSLFEPGGRAVQLEGDVRVLHVGSLVTIKDQPTLLRAIARAKQAEPGIHLHVVGDGPLHAELADLARALGLHRNATFHGQVDRTRLASYYRAAKVVAVSSRYEAQSAVALEAALCGVPVVGTAVGLVADFAPQATAAVRIGDEAALADAIRAATRPEMSQALADEAGRLVRSHYLAAHTADTLMRMYENLAVTGMAA